MRGPRCKWRFSPWPASGPSKLGPYRCPQFIHRPVFLGIRAGSDNGCYVNLAGRLALNDARHDGPQPAAVDHGRLARPDVMPGEGDRTSAQPSHLTRRRAEHARPLQGPGYFARRSSLRIDSSASMTSSRETRLLAKLNLRWNALVGGRKAKT